MNEEHERHMRRALALARRGWGRVQPNPMVGAVVVRDGAVVGTGWHAEYGGPHAEVAALRSAGERARGATVYVSLEPCAHRGKTPPCTDALVEAGVARVVFAAADPTSARGGAERLRAAGIEVLGGVAADAARALNAAFFHLAERQRCWLTLKYALSLDARLADAPGRRTRVTGSEAQAETHRLRAGYDAILVGARTARVDDPLLTVRGDVVPRRPPARVVLDTEAATPTSSRLAATSDEAPFWVVCAEDAPRRRIRQLERAGAEVLTCARGGTGVDLAGALAALWSRGVRTVLCEGGGRLGSALLDAALVDRLVLFYAPRLFGEAGVPAFRTRTDAAWTLVGASRLGDDVMVTYDHTCSAAS